MNGKNTSGYYGNKGNATSMVFDKLAEVHGMGVVCAHHIDYDQATFSNGFMSAVSAGRLPILGTEECSAPTMRGMEYHHFLFEGECWVAYFDGEDND